jgi:sugar (pentulose or hexulose) kinase
VAFLLRAKLDDLRAAGCSPHRVVLGGGGSQHPAWRQMLADVLALPLHPAGTGWLTARGAARLAAAAGGAVTGAGTEGRSAENLAAPVRARGYERAEAAYQRFRSARA